jgi:hypothetical protein
MSPAARGQALCNERRYPGDAQLVLDLAGRAAFEATPQVKLGHLLEQWWVGRLQEGEGVCAPGILEDL